MSTFSPVMSTQHSPPQARRSRHAGGTAGASQKGDGWVRGWLGPKVQGAGMLLWIEQREEGRAKSLLAIRYTLDAAP